MPRKACSAGLVLLKSCRVKAGELGISGWWGQRLDGLSGARASIQILAPKQTTFACHSCATAASWDVLILPLRPSNMLPSLFHSPSAPIRQTKQAKPLRKTCQPWSELVLSGRLEGSCGLLLNSTVSFVPGVFNQLMCRTVPRTDYSGSLALRGLHKCFVGSLLNGHQASNEEF